MTITEFIEANLGRIERTALAAEGAHGYAWEADGTGNVRGPGGFPVVYVENGAPEPPAAAHIALNDPDHVRTWVAGLRAVVDACTRSVWAAGESGSYLADAILAHVAGIFADQPGYDEEWR